MEQSYSAAKNTFRNSATCGTARSHICRIIGHQSRVLSVCLTHRPTTTGGENGNETRLSSSHEKTSLRIRRSTDHVRIPKAASAHSVQLHNRWFPQFQHLPLLGIYSSPLTAAAHPIAGRRRLRASEATFPLRRPPRATPHEDRPSATRQSPRGRGESPVPACSRRGTAEHQSRRRPVLPAPPPTGNVSLPVDPGRRSAYGGYTVQAVSAVTAD